MTAGNSVLPPNVKLEVLKDPASLARRAADWLFVLAKSKDGIFSVALSGGSTPKLLYHYLTEPVYRDSFPWSRTHWFWSDERYVPHDDEQSNYRMVREALLSHAPIPEENIHAVPTDAGTPEATALLYEQELRTFRLDPTQPLFDVVFLGLGTDGHTASLFPGTSALDVRDRWVASVMVPKLGPRITLTYPALESARNMAFLIAGSEKRDIFNRFREGQVDLPATRVRCDGNVTWFADEAAASGPMAASA